LKRLAIVLAAALAALTVYVVTAPAGEQTSASRISSLEAKVTKLQKQVKTLNTLVGSCVLVQAIPMQQFGNGSSEGYFYHPSGAPSGAYTLSSALDFPLQGQTPQFWTLSTSSQCAQIINTGKTAALPKVPPAGLKQAPLARVGVHRVAQH